MAELQKLPGLLLPWYEQNKRDLPWRQDRDPYRVWLSEIMLQQTRVEAVKGYYARFLEALPTPRCWCAGRVSCGAITCSTASRRPSRWWT